MNKEKRTWVYLNTPSDFSYLPCDCGNKDTQWSEFYLHLWCDKCKKDFVPKDHGILDGPVCLNLCRLMGIDFSRVNLLTGNVEKFDEKIGEYVEIKS